MEVQIFGIRKSPETRKALRFFAERRIKTHFVDLQERAASLGELRRFAQKFGVTALVDRESRRFADLGLGAARLSDDRWLDKLVEEPLAASSSAGAVRSAAHRRRRRGDLARVDRPVTQLALAGVAVEFGATRLLSDVTLTVARGEKWGIIGRNGSGKTTLLRLITGEIEPSAGTVARASGLRWSVMDQHRDFAGADTAWEAAAGAFAELLALERSLAEQAAALAEAGDRSTPQMLARYDRDLERFDREGGYTLAARIDAVLHGLGFDPDEARTRPLESLSGGERSRLGLAQQLVAPADVLLLDEPTNHLDLETTRWLEQYLRGLDATVLLISHDRAFLQAVVDHVLHLESGTAVSYAGDYQAFLRQRADRRLAQRRAFVKQARTIAAEEDFIRRNIAGTSAVPMNGNLVGATTPAPELHKVYYYHRYARRHYRRAYRRGYYGGYYGAYNPGYYGGYYPGYYGGYYRRY